MIFGKWLLGLVYPKMLHTLLALPEINNEIPERSQRLSACPKMNDDHGYRQGQDIH